jgi:hypothetical protein
MALLKRKTEDEKESAAAEKARAARISSGTQERIAKWQEDLPRWEYTTKYQREGRQKGFWGGGLMAAEFSAMGKAGWELVGIYEERAVFKRRMPPLGDLKRFEAEATDDANRSEASDAESPTT